MNIFLWWLLIGIQMSNIFILILIRYFSFITSSEFQNRDVATSPEPSRSRSRLSGSQSSLCKPPVSFDTCAEGECVLVVWNNFHCQYTIAQDSPLLYFLHGDSYTGLNLSVPCKGSTPNIIYCVGIVLEKQYCHARKDENRYRVSKGTKFYRVKVGPRKCDYPKSSSSSKRQKLESGGSSSPTDSVSRSTSMENCNQQQQQFQLISSFAQTDFLDTVIEDAVTASGKDMIDSGVVTHQKSMYKDRNISVTEEDETTSLEDRCRYVSVSEEEELAPDTRSEEVI